MSPDLETPEEKPPVDIDEELDRELDDTFPASDPPEILRREK